MSDTAKHEVLTKEKCALCGRFVAVLWSGLFRHHLAYRGDFDPCPGSSRRPSDVRSSR